MDLEKEQERSIKVKRILEDEIFVEAIQKIRQDLQIEWLNSELQNTEQRENIFVMRRMLEVVLVQLQSVMETGKLSQKK